MLKVLPGGRDGVTQKELMNLLLSHPDMGYQEIGDIVGCSRQRVYQVAKRAALTRDPKPRNYRSDVSVERVLELYHQGILVKDIAQVLRCTNTTVGKRLRAAGINKSECYSRSMKLDWRGDPKIRASRREVMKTDKDRKKDGLRKILKQKRVRAELTLHQLSVASGVSQSELARIEGGERYPSAPILQKLAKPLGFEESELFTLAGYMTPQPPTEVEKPPGTRLDPYVAKVLSEEPVEIQRTVIGILTILKSMTKGSVKL